MCLGVLTPPPPPLSFLPPLNQVYHVLEPGNKIVFKGSKFSALKPQHLGSAKGLGDGRICFAKTLSQAVYCSQRQDAMFSAASSGWQPGQPILRIDLDKLPPGSKFSAQDGSTSNRKLLQHMGEVIALKEDVMIPAEAVTAIYSTLVPRRGLIVSRLRDKVDSIKGFAKRSFEEWEFEFNRILGQSCLSELEAECECPKWKWEKVLREAGNEYRPPPPVNRPVQHQEKRQRPKPRSPPAPQGRSAKLPRQHKQGRISVKEEPIDDDRQPNHDDASRR